MASKQESLNDYYQMAKEIAKVEKELSIEQWDFVTIERNGDKECEHIRLYSYNLPRRVVEKYEWVIRWRAARLQCQYPRYTITVRHGLYKKVMGENIGMQKDIDIFVAAKAQLSKLKRALAEYIEYQRNNNMFYNEETDEQTLKYKAKLAIKEQNVADAEARLIEKVRLHKKTEVNYEHNSNRTIEDA